MRAPARWRRDDLDEHGGARHRHPLGGADEASRERVAALGGLYVIGTNRHESRRVDLQLRGRAGRQGDPGEIYASSSASKTTSSCDMGFRISCAGVSGPLSEAPAEPRQRSRVKRRRRCA